MPVFDIATMGSSLTAGNAVSRSWHRELRRALVPGRVSTVRTYNFGIGGADTNTGLSIVNQVIALRPKAVLIEYSANDCQLSFSVMRAKTIDLINALKTGAPNTAIYLMVMNPVVGSGVSAVGRPNLPTFHQMYRDLSVSENVGLIDTAPAWLGVTISEIPDGLHALPDTNRARLIPGIVAALAPSII